MGILYDQQLCHRDLRTRLGQIFRVATVGSVAFTRGAQVSLLRLVRSYEVSSSSGWQQTAPSPVDFSRRDSFALLPRARTRCNLRWLIRYDQIFDVGLPANSLRLCTANLFLVSMVSASRYPRSSGHPGNERSRQPKEWMRGQAWSPFKTGCHGKRWTGANPADRRCSPPSPELVGDGG